MMQMRTAVASCLAAAWMLQLAAPAAASIADTLSAAAAQFDRFMTAEPSESAPATFDADSDENLELGAWNPGPFFKSRNKYSFALAGTMGACESGGDSRKLYVSGKPSKDGDYRDTKCPCTSSYVYGSTDARESAYFMPVYDSEKKAYKLWHQPRHGCCTHGYAAVHKEYSGDSLPDGELRMIIHTDSERAVLWDLWKKDSKTYVFTVKENLETPGLAVGMVLGTPTTAEGNEAVGRDGSSTYLAVVKDMKCATLMEIVNFY